MSSKGWLETLDNLGYRSWWLLACWHASQTDSLFDSARHGKLLLLITLVTMGRDGCPKRSCHHDRDGLSTLKTCFIDAKWRG
jgi:hypothetical protein